MVSFEVQDAQGQVHQHSCEEGISLLEALQQAVPEAELMLISGNHDSAPRIDLYRGILRAHKIHVIGEPPRAPQDHIERVTLRDAFGPVHFWLLPFVKPGMVRAITGAAPDGTAMGYEDAIRCLLDREDIDPEARNVLVSHQFYVPAGQLPEDAPRADSEIRAVGNVDAVSGALLQRFDYAALGHIHKPWALDACHRYCGTPLACSVSEAGQQKGSVLVELGPKGQVVTTVLPLQPLRAVRVLTGTLQELAAEPSQDYVAVVLTDRGDLNAAELSDRLHSAFPNLLYVTRETARTADYTIRYTREAEKDAFTLCAEFLGDLDAESQAILRDVINTVQEVG